LEKKIKFKFLKKIYIIILKNIFNFINGKFSISNQEKKFIIDEKKFGKKKYKIFQIKDGKIYLDSYPNKKKDVEIYSIDLKKPLFAKKEKILKGVWETNIGKLDAHVRVSANGNYFCIDDIFKKMRSIKIFKFNN